MSDLISEFNRMFDKRMISYSRRGREEVIRLSTGAVISEAPLGLVIPLARARQLQKIAEVDAPMEEMLEKYILDEASK